MTTFTTLSPVAQATLLLTSYFSSVSDEQAKPLSIGEWARFALWLKEKSLSPADLLTQNPVTQLQGWADICAASENPNTENPRSEKISTERIIALLNRGHSLALAMEKWQRAGLWVVTRADPAYPKRLKQRLKTQSPPVLFGCGNKTLLNAGGLAVVGSRNASEPDLTFASTIGAKAAREQIAIVSGGARGIDEAAMTGATKQGGAVIGVMANSLLTAATSSKWRAGLMNGNTVLLSPYYPEAGFSAGNAIARNKYIYCLADSALVVHSGKTGGTFHGATENLKQSWVPLWVKHNSNNHAANADLVEKGGMWLSTDINESDNSNASTLAIGDLIQAPSGQMQPNMAEQVDFLSAPAQSAHISEPAPKAENQAAQTNCTANFYQLFTEQLQRLAQEPVSIDTLTAATQLHPSQVAEWLARAEQQGIVKKLNNPERYQVCGN